MQARSPLLVCYRGMLPRIADDAWIAPNAAVTGDTEIGSHSSIWFGCVLRGDVSPIRIGARVNIQDGTIVHVSAASCRTPSFARLAAPLGRPAPGRFPPCPFIVLSRG
jgi:carbonic anhydrase/acetyltransferase-like protein (isoleucine patch superfamily)